MDDALYRRFESYHRTQPKDNMEIIVRGGSGEGRSAVAQHIAEALQIAGFAVVHDAELKRSPEQQRIALTSLAWSGRAVTITEEQVVRSK